MMNYMYLSLSFMLIRWLLASNMIPSHSLGDSYSSEGNDILGHRGARNNVFWNGSDQRDFLLEI